MRPPPYRSPLQNEQPNKDAAGERDSGRWLFHSDVVPHSPSSSCLSGTIPARANPLALRVHGHLINPVKSRIPFILMTTRSQESTHLDKRCRGRPAAQDKVLCLCSSRVTPPVPMAMPQATQPDPDPGVRDATCSVTRSVPVAAPPDPLIPVPGVEEATP
ncbi:hypothetical protein P4O66_009393 [Electrophorus voltai]|uniref:Uncharacterized protein n=1 Tax=Electrophorus voltai TaxID=2609070 RepID=A0AAD9DYW0_9TELE|nr:hypothetical protein P4O66_009393 [Electrophorus voltai]